MMSATIGWRANVVVLAIASITGGCLCSGICDSETRLTASIYLAGEGSGCLAAEGDANQGAEGDANQGEEGDANQKEYYIVALITDKMQLASVNLPRLLESSQTQIGFEFMQFLNWGDEEKFLTRSNIVIALAPTNASGTQERVILYPDRDPNGMLYIQLALIKKKPRNWTKFLNKISKKVRVRDEGWTLGSDLSFQSYFTAAILDEFANKGDIVYWNTYSFFEKDRYSFLGKEYGKSEDMRLPIKDSGLCLEVTAWNHAPS